MSQLIIKENSIAPGTPASGKVALYPKSDGFFYTKDDAGTEVQLRGSQIRTGAGVPSNGLGNDTDFYINSTNDDYYTKASGTWTLQGNIHGATGTLAVGTVSTGIPGSSATVTNVGTSTAAVFDFSIPRGDNGTASNNIDGGHANTNYGGTNPIFGGNA